MSGLDLVVPVAMEFVSADLDQRKLIVRDFDAGLVYVGIQLGVDLESFRGGGRRNQIDDCLKTPQRLTAPVLSDVREQPVFDLVPFAGSRREVAHGDSQSGFIGELLQLDLP